MKAAQRYLDTVGRYFAVADFQQYELVLGVAAAHFIPGEMLWVRLPGGSRAGKTSSALEPLLDHPATVPLEHLTPASIRGGLGKGARLLKRLDTKLVITKELAPILTIKKDARNEIFGLLRSVKDGRLSADFGTEEGYIDQTARFDWILGVTEQGFAQARKMEDLLGARFLDIRWKSADRGESARRAQRNNAEMESIKAELKALAGAVLAEAEQRQKDSPAPLPTNCKEIIELADLAARVRTPVPRGYQNRIAYVPTPEHPTDLAQGMTRIAQGLYLLGVEESLPHMARIAASCIPDIRLGVLDAIVRGVVGVNPMARYLHVPPATLYDELEEMTLLDIVEQREGEDQWRITATVQAQVDFLWRFASAPWWPRPSYTDKVTL